MGDHGVMLKHLIHFHGLLRVPFIWSDPEASVQQGVIEDLAGNSIARPFNLDLQSTPDLPKPAPTTRSFKIK